MWAISEGKNRLEVPALEDPYQSKQERNCVCVYMHARVRTCSVMPDSLQPRGLQHTRLLYLRNFPGKNTGAGCHFLFQEIFL